MRGIENRMAELALPVLVAVILVVQPATASATDGPLTVTTDTTLTEEHQGSIVITADDVTLDCAGHTVRGDGTGFGIHLDGRSGVTVTRCMVTGFFFGVVLENSSRNTLVDNTASQNVARGMSLTSSGHNNVTGNDISDTNSGDLQLGAGGLVLNGGSSHNSVTFNTVTGTESTGINISDSSSNRIIANVIADSGDTGLGMFRGTFNTLSRNIAVHNGDVGFFLREDSHRNVLRNNAACRNGTFDAVDEVPGGGGIWVNNLFCTESIN